MNIQEITFGPQQYLTLKKTIATTQITDKAMYDEAGKKLYGYLQQNNLSPSGKWSVLYFTWDEANHKAEIGIAVPIKDIKSVDDPELVLVDIPETKASMTVLHGPYTGLGEAHQGLMNYISEHKFDTTNLSVIAIEEYVVDPMSDPNPENLITNIYYLYK